MLRYGSHNLFLKMIKERGIKTHITMQQIKKDFYLNNNGTALVVTKSKSCYSNYDLVKPSKRQVIRK